MRRVGDNLPPTRRTDYLATEPQIEVASPSAACSGSDRQVVDACRIPAKDLFALVKREVFGGVGDIFARTGIQAGRVREVRLEQHVVNAERARACDQITLLEPRA